MKSKRMRIVSVVLLFGLFQWVLLVGFLKETAVSSTQQGKFVSDACVADKSILDDIKARKESLDNKEAQIQEKEKELAQREAALTEEIKKLEDLRKEISKTQGELDQKQQEKVAKLVEAMEKMSPKSGAQMLAGVNEELAIRTMEGLSTPKLAKILSVLEANRSAEMAELLAYGKKLTIRSPASNGAERNSIRKGGENK